jgi:membrane-associated phospholipid phosphatase
MPGTTGTGARAARRTRLLWLAGQTGFVLLCIYLYFRIRNLTEGSAAIASAHARDIVALEEQLGLDVEASLQAPVLDSERFSAVANAVYIYGHWPVIAATMVWTAWRHREVFLRLRDAMIVSGLMGMVVFVSYPVAPPRLVDLGLVDTVTEQSTAYRVLQPPQFTNQYAAMPSLHAGWDLLVGIAIVTAASSLLLKAIGYAMPVLMAASVVVTANHYILDVVAGVALALVGHAVAVALQRRRAAQAARAAPHIDGVLAEGSPLPAALPTQRSAPDPAPDRAPRGSGPPG